MKQTDRRTDGSLHCIMSPMGGGHCASKGSAQKCKIGIAIPGSRIPGTRAHFQSSSPNPGILGLESRPRLPNWLKKLPRISCFITIIILLHSIVSKGTHGAINCNFPLCLVCYVAISLAVTMSFSHFLAMYCHLGAILWLAAWRSG